MNRTGTNRRSVGRCPRRLSLNVRHPRTMPTRRETQEIVASFQRYNKTGTITEIEGYSLEELRRADEDLEWRDQRSAYRIALTNRIRDLEEMTSTGATTPPKPQVPPWVVVVGAIFGGLTLLFLMALVVMSTIGYEVPCESRFLVVAVLAFGAALGSSFLGGTAAAKGAIPLPYAHSHPLQFSVVGGVAVLIVVLIGGRALFCERKVILAVPNKQLNSDGLKRCAF